MPIQLYPDNQTAYASAMSMLAETGRAAVIHPTGTGKSFIGFRLCEDHPDTRVCWISPSEYIFQTQRENVTKSGTTPPKNITFLTYAKLMSMGQPALESLAPGYIILDEYHRAGAYQWKKGVARLLSMYPNAPVLGLSATNIRYLDNCRNMAEELFDSCVASELTLGEAIASGILQAPKYVLAAFSLEPELKRYEEKLRRIKDQAVQAKAEKYMEQLRRSIQNAENLDTIFQKHIQNKNGKYILFVPNVETMQSVKNHAKSGFITSTRNPTSIVPTQTTRKPARSSAPSKRMPAPISSCCWPSTC